MSPTVPRLSLALAVAALATGGCVPLRAHQGYVVDVDLVNSVQPGVDNRQSVLQVLGKPTFAGQFDGADWYYLARDTHNLAFRNPRATSQLTIEISFDAGGTVSTIRRGNTEQIASIQPSGKETPTLGKKRGLLEDLFGNIGTVGTGGGGADGGQGGGGGRDTP